MAMYDEAFVGRVGQALRGLLPGWGLGPGTELRLLTVSENATFLARDPGRANPVILRVHRLDYHSRAEIESELAWIAALRDGAVVDTPALVPLLGGGHVAELDDAGAVRHVVAFEFIAGDAPDADAQLVAGFGLLGRISARLHVHAQGWARPAGFVRKEWDFESAFGARALWGDWRAAEGLTPEGRAVLERLCVVLQGQLAAYGKGADRFGLIHADLRLANLMVQGDDLAVIDFDDCGFSWFVYDFASAITFHELSPLVPELQRAWLAGYRAVRSLSAEDEAMLPSFIAFRRLLITAWLASHAETPTAAEIGPAQYTAGTVELARRYLGDAA